MGRAKLRFLIRHAYFLKASADVCATVWEGTKGGCGSWGKEKSTKQSDIFLMKIGIELISL
ncbi:hypothetical protein K788_0005075 (plasmid) [Paraburkholderia caribensis MBA4]|uniref:Uncharacterized protein n=1 Tax=Paraburkholderia caribensis MBA4 TaxID=1323664 RepID=A0A0P0RKS6_9BURK|nr:hypothetical protein K788_0005075 [Paraburkholderia caribensis MBA4]